MSTLIGYNLSTLTFTEFSEWTDYRISVSPANPPCILHHECYWQTNDVSSAVVACFPVRYVFTSWCNVTIMHRWTVNLFLDLWSSWMLSLTTETTDSHGHKATSGLTLVVANHFHATLHSNITNIHHTGCNVLAYRWITILLAIHRIQCAYCTVPGKCTLTCKHLPLVSSRLV